MPPVTPETSPLLANVRDLPAGERVVGYYLVTRLEIKPKRAGGSYLELHLQDGSGKMDARMWEGFEDVPTRTKPGDVVKIDAVRNDYNDSRTLIIERMRPATLEEVPDPKAFLPHSPLATEQAREQLAALMDSISKEPIRRLLQTIFDDADFLRIYLTAPAGKQWHHAEIGGLVQHTLTLAHVADCICQFYPQLNRDLLVTGAILHDIGKVFELTADHAIDYTVDGRLMGHIYLGATFVEEKISQLTEFPPEIRRQLVHMILAHQGDGTMGSPVKPMTLESLVIHYLDQLDSKLNAFQRVRAQTPDGQPFSEYVKLMDRFFYLQSIDTQGDGLAGGPGNGG
jgi:3'-5' exoribonuclease